VKDYKSILMSTTFWGAIISAFSLLFPNVYAKFGITDQTVLVSHIVGAIGTIITIYGRFTATKKVTLTGRPPAQ